MLSINNKSIIDLSSFVNIQQLLELKPFFDYAVVKSSANRSPARYSGTQFLEPTQIGIADVLNDYDNSTLPFIADLKAHDLFAAWLRYQHPITYGQQSVQIIYPKTWESKHFKDGAVPTENVQYFDFFFKWLDEQNIFSEYGRVVVFINEPGVASPIHKDWLGETQKDQFIWLTLDSRKKFFVYDSNTQEKHYLPGQIGTFDNAGWHGSDISQFASWSIRVDGVFSDTFLNKTGMYSHFKS